MATYYRWSENTVNYTEIETEISDRQIGTNIFPPLVIYSSDSITTDGTHITLDNPEETTLNAGNQIRIYGTYFLLNKTSGNSVYKNTSNYCIAVYDDYLNVTIENGTIYTVEIERELTFVKYVYSMNRSEYPNGGEQGDYYYNQRTTVTSPTAPTNLQYPNPITTPTVTVSWEAATSNVPDYPVEKYRITYGLNGPIAPDNSQIAGETTGTSYELSIPPGTASIQIRINAFDTNNGQAIADTAIIPVNPTPALTVPSLLMQGQQAAISWSAIEWADSYTVQRKANTDADWTQVYSGASTTFSETVGTWTSVQYRVQAVFSGTPGGWATSASIPVISASALVISGTDGDLGTLVNDVPYTISTDTGNQITATITVNSAVIFSGNVGNSTADVIPVLDLVNGEGTIVIEASVTASGGPVSAVRTWTYTKAAITFPNAGSVAQLTQQGANIWPKVLAECVRLPGGGTLDEVMGFPCQVYSGSYVGTGTYGEANPNTLTFPFEPKAVFICGVEGPSFAYMPLVKQSGLTPVWIGSTLVVSSVQWSGNSVSWQGNSASSQLNSSGNAYYYVAIG